MQEQRPKLRIAPWTWAVIFGAMGLAPTLWSQGNGAKSGTPPAVLGESRAVENSQAAGGLSAEAIIARMIAANRARDARLQRYTAIRLYRAANPRFKKSAQMQVQVTFESPGTKQFKILAEKGSGTIRKRVFNGIMEAEVDALKPEMKRRSAINTDNYRFTLRGEETIDGRRGYVLDAEPQREDKYLFRGRLWIDADEFALMRVKGRPAKMPSFWTHKVDLVREYQKVGDFWLLTKDESESEIRIFGKSDLVIEHSNYQIEASDVKSP